MCGTFLVCRRCGKAWKYKGCRAYSNCPNCYTSVRTLKKYKKW